MNSKIIKIVSGLLAVFIIVYVAVQIVNFFYSPYQAETLFRTTVNNSICTQGIVIRDETVLSQTKGGILSYQVQEGGKVAQSSVIANKYATEQDMLSQEKIESIDREIVVLTEAQKKGSTAAATIDSVTSLLNEAYLSLMTDINNRSYDALEESRLKLQELFCKKRIVIGKEQDFNARIEALKQERNGLQNSISQSTGKIESPESGYFSQYIDGLESKYNCDNAEKVTLSELNGLFEQKQNYQADANGDSIGKLIKSFEWKFVTSVSSAELPSIKPGASVHLIFPSYGNTKYKASVANVESGNGQERNIVVLNCDIIDSSIARMRLEEVEIVLSEVPGIQVPKKAVRYENDTIGVYEKIGKKLYFRKIDQLYETDEYIISALHNEEDDPKHSFVWVYDDAVVKGRDLYDKKPIR